MDASTVVAGIDVGNSTTEIVLVDADSRRPVAWDRTPTRGSKGSPESLDTAAALLRRVTKRADVVVDRLGVAPLHPVRTMAAVIPEPRASTGRLVACVGGSDTVGNVGFAVGRPVRVDDDPPRDGDVVALVSSSFGFRSAVQRVTQWQAAGVSVVAVVCADDEAVLLSNRLAGGIPVVDGVAVERLSQGSGVDQVAVEVAPLGHPLVRLTDPMVLISSLGLGDAEQDVAVTVASRLVDARAAAVGVTRDQPARSSDSDAATSWVQWTDGRRSTFHDAHPLIREGPPGQVSRFHVARPDSDPAGLAAADLVTVRLDQVGDAALVRRGTVGDHAFVISSLSPPGDGGQPAQGLRDRTGLDVQVASSEAAAARRGALSTPGVPPDGAVLDLGGGTLDLVVGDDAVVGAGAGELLTVSVAELLGVPRGAAEWAKRGPAMRMDSPHVLVAEDGSRSFAQRRPPADAIGSLVVAGPAGWLAVSRHLSASEWRALRLSLKREVLGVGVRRLLAAGLTLPSALVVVGGPAGDDETVRVLADVLGSGMAVGRGAVAEVLGHRYAVAHGLALMVLDGADARRA